MELHALRSFQFVAELKSFSKAALHLRIAQPAVSRQIQKLEREFGVALFSRNGRGIELTGPGALLLERARSLLGQAGRVADEVRAHAETVAGTLVVGAPPTIGDVTLPAVVEACARRFPALRLDIVENASPRLYEKLLGKELSLCILHNPKPHREIAIEPVLVDDLYLIGPGRPIGSMRPVTEASDLEGLPLILPRPPHNRRLTIDEACAREGVKLDVRMNVDGFTIIRALVEQGFGYSILSYYGISEMCRDGRLSAVKLRRPPMSWTLAIAFRKELAASAGLGELVGMLKASVRAIVDDGRWRGEPLYVAK
jgi:LysR family nitrogen assimilation transcriptional regulator